MSNLSLSHRTLLRACCAPDPQVATALHEVERLDLIDSVDYHGEQLLPLLFRRSQQAKISLQSHDRLVKAYKRTWQRNQLLLYRARPVFDYLNSIDEPFTVLKGGAIISGEYLNDLGVRPMGDIDFIVAPGAVHPLAEWMLTRGWELNSGPWSLSEAELAHHALDFTNSDGGALDIHREMLHRDRSPELDVAMMESAIETTSGTTPVRVPNPTSLLMQTLAHAKPEGVRHVGDALTIIRLHESQIDWDALASECIARRAIAPALEAIELVRQVDQQSIPLSVVDKLTAARRHWADFCFEDRPVDNRKQALRNFAALLSHRTQGRDPLSAAKISVLLARRLANSAGETSVLTKVRSLVANGPTSSARNQV